MNRKIPANIGLLPPPLVPSGSNSAPIFATAGLDENNRNSTNPRYFIYHHSIAILNVANSSIAYLLNEYSASQEALKIILGVTNVPTYYVTELSTDSNGRPDVTGLDCDGSKSVIIEGKFWANLTHGEIATPYYSLLFNNF